MPLEMGYWWPFFQRFIARVNLQQPGWWEDLIAALARRSSSGSPRQAAQSLLAQGLPPLPRALIAQALAFAESTTSTVPVPARGDGPREQALLAYLRAVRAEPAGDLPDGPEPVAVLARARTGDAQARASLGEVVAQDLLVDAWVALDPALCHAAPRPWR